MELEMFHEIKTASHEIKTAFYEKICGNSSVGRALASQAEGHEFEPRLPLIMKALIVNRLAIEVFCF